MPDITPSSLWKRYLTALTLILVFILGSHWFSFLGSAVTDQAATAINTSGRQRMLSQRILFFASEMRAGEQGTAEELAAALELYSKSHEPFRLAIPPSEHLTRLYV